MKAAMYLRQSSDPNNDHLGIDRQRQDCVRLCEANGWGWAEYVDNDTSASTRKPRPAYQAMLTDIRNGAIGAVVVWDLDRLYRLPRELEDLIDLADEYRIALATVTGDVDLGTDNGRLYARIKGAVARGETERKVARMKRRYEQDREQGKPYGVARAFGYRPDHSPDPRTAPAVRQAYADVLAGRSLYAIAQDWNAKGFTSARGKRWAQTGVRAVLLNAKNAGLVTYAGEVVGQGNWAAIVDRDVYENVAAMLADPQRRIGGRRGRKYLLSGLAICGKCGKTLGSAMPSKRGQMARYHCKHCHGVARKIESVDKYVLDVVAERLSQPDAIDLLTKRDTLNTAALRDRANALRARQQNLAVDYAEDRISRAAMLAGTESVNAQLAEIDVQVTDAAKARILRDVIVPGDHDAVLSRIASKDLDRQRAIVDVLLTITVLPGQARGELRRDLLPITWK